MKPKYTPEQLRDRRIKFLEARIIEDEAELRQLRAEALGHHADCPALNANSLLAPQCWCGGRS